MPLARSTARRRDPIMDRRAADRTYDLVRAVCVGDGGESFRCLCLDLSITGACVRFNAIKDVPSDVTFRLPDANRSWRARIRWRDGNDAGLMFLDREH